ncbi:flippase [Heyndrickxia coagulans]|uniref:flippase n=1 Tax=Heyndrickxia coagulans TaxID=1398 RepID=UPI0018A702F2|nr:flippase [Heyndrickxia coagulans]MBF8417256.1 flippase [Heyndrickxia coagulans]
MSIVKNYIYNVIYQIVTLIVPLITVPYVSRVLGSNGIGINAYTNSIVQYFILLGTIGISLYGNRTIAYVRDDKAKLSWTFWNIFTLQVVASLIALLAFLLFIFIMGAYQSIFLLQSIYLLSAIIDISWLYMGLEDFKKTVIRNMLVKIIGVISIFIFIRTSNDLWKYVLILSTSQFFGNLTLWMYIPKTVGKFNVQWKNVKRHLIPSISLFVPQIAIQIYIVLNKTMLGYLSNTGEVGFFDNADKIVKVVLSVVTAMGTVMLPRISNTFARGDMRKVKEYLYRSFDFASYLSIPMMFGLMGIADDFSLWFFGSGFSKTGPIIIIMSPIIIFIAWSNVIGNQYMLSIGRIREYTKSVTVGAFANFFFNLLLIPEYHSIGAAFSTLISEFIVTFIQLFFIRKDINYRKIFSPIWKYTLSSLIMYIVIIYSNKIFGISFYTTFLQISIAWITYFIMLLILKAQLNTLILKKIIYLIIKTISVGKGA